jgi:hypothetical protein
MMDIDALKVADLKAELGKRGLPTEGKKRDLQDRLKAAVAEGWWRRRHCTRHTHTHTANPSHALRDERRHCRRRL